MKSNLYLKSFIVLLAAATVLACSPDKAAQLEELKLKKVALDKEIAALEKEVGGSDSNKVKSKEVAIVEVATRKFDHYVQTQGNVESEDNVLVSAKSMGIITQVFVNEGQSVSKGQTLAQIDNAITVRTMEEVKSSLELAKTVYERQKNLWDQKIGTEVQFLQAKNTKESLENRVATLQEQLDMSRIKSPINGTVEEINVKAGENVAPGMPAFRVVNTSDLKVKLNISEAYITTIKKGDKVSITIPDINKTFVSSVNFVGRNIDVLSRSFPVEVSLPAAADLRPNMTAVIRIIFHTDPSALCVPINIVQEVNGEKIVYVAEQNGNQTIARKKVVEVVGVYDNLAQVKSGLKVGDKIITVGYQGLNDGEFVKI